MTRIAIVDQRPRFFDAVAAALVAEGFAVDSPDDVEAWSGHHGRLVIIDLTQPENVGLVQRLRDSGSQTPILGLVDGGTVQDYADALHCGATNVVGMRAQPHVIVDAIHAALVGRVILPPAIAQELAQVASTHMSRPKLSAQDLRLLRMMAAGESMAKIARRLHVSERTLYREAQRLNAVLGVKTRAEALIKAAQWGFLTSDVSG